MEMRCGSGCGAPHSFLGNVANPQMLGYAADLAFYYVPDKPHITGLHWRLMLGSAGFPALIVLAQIFFLPESPRWLMSKGRYTKAFTAMKRLRNHELQAARDIFYIFVLLREEESIVRGRNRVWEMFSIGRNRRAMIGSEIVRRPPRGATNACSSCSASSSAESTRSCTT